MNLVRRVTAGVFVAGLAVGGLAGCAGTTEEAETAACESYDSFNDAVESAQETLTGTPTVGEIRDARDEIRASYERLSTNLQTVAADRQKDLESAIDRFNDAVNDVSDGMTVSEAVKSLNDEFGDITASEIAVSSELNCS